MLNFKGEKFTEKGVKFYVKMTGKKIDIQFLGWKIDRKKIDVQFLGQKLTGKKLMFNF